MVKALPSGAVYRRAGQMGGRRATAGVDTPSPRARTNPVGTCAGRGSRVTRSSRYPGSGVTFVVGGIRPSRMHSSAAARSSGAAPEYSRPVIVLGAVTGTPDGPNTAV